MAIQIRRREFIFTLGGAAAAWPLAVRAQQGERMRRIGVLMSLAANDPEARLRVAAFEKGLRDFGWMERRSLEIEYRWADNANVLPSHATDLVRMTRRIQVLVAGALAQSLNRGTPSRLGCVNEEGDGASRCGETPGGLLNAPMWNRKGW
jgi:putative ABC transport system substrate-binding protein